MRQDCRLLEGAAGILMPQFSLREYNLRHQTWILLAVSAALLAGCSKGDEGGNLAVVNGDPITMQDFHAYLKTKERVRVVTSNGVQEANVADTLAFQALEELISRQVMIQLAKDEGLFPNAADVTKELEFRKTLNTNYLTALTARGLTLERIKEAITSDLCIERLLTQGVTVTPEEVEQFITENPQQFTEPALCDMLWIFVKSEEAKQNVERQLQSGQGFSTVAIQYSEAPQARQAAGRYGTRVVNQMPESVRKIAEGTAEGSSSAWIEGDGGFAKFYVEKKTAARPMQLDATRKEYIRRELAKARGAQASDLGKRLADRLFESEQNIKIAPKDLQDVWQRALDRAKEQRKVDVPSASTSGTNAPN